MASLALVATLLVPAVAAAERLVNIEAEPRASFETGTKTLQRLGVFYGWPSLINRAGSIARAAAQLSRYNTLVLGGGLQDPSHADHAKTCEIVAQLSQTEVYGYLSLAPARSGSLAQLRQQVQAWKAVGVVGIFFDEAGFDFGNTRERQNAAFAIVHAEGLRVFANAHNPADLFAQTTDGLGTTLRAGDSYLYESFAVAHGTIENATVRSQKLARLADARRLGVRIFGVTTAPSRNYFDGAAWRQAQLLADAHALDGLGWGEFQFAATDSRMPLRTN